MRLAPLLAVGFCGAVAGALVSDALRDDGDAGRLARTEARLHRMEQQLDAVGHEPPRIVLPTGVAARRTEPAQTTESGDTHRVVAAPQEVDVVRVVEARTASEPRDSMWSATAERQLELAYRSAGLEGSRLGELRCASTACRMTFAHDDEDAVALFREELALRNPFARSSVLVEQRVGPTGEHSSVVLVARSGHGLAATR